LNYTFAFEIFEKNPYLYIGGADFLVFLKNQKTRSPHPFSLSDVKRNFWLHTMCACTE